MRVIVNQTEYQLPSGSKVSDVIGLMNAKPPYAVAVNLSFVPKTKHAEHILQENDRIEIIAPVTGG
jgi:sulfur carrier protein